MKRLAIYAHYDAQGEVKPYVAFYLRRLRECFERVELVSTAALSDEQLRQAAALCDDVTIRDNRGFDFGMWQHAIEGCDLERWDELLLTNSSVFGPVAPLAPLLERMARADCAFWGMTDSHEIAWHLQSYFLVFKRPALRAEAFTQFWRSVLPYADKQQVIRSYELGLSAFLQDHGLEPAALVPAASLRKPRWRRQKPEASASNTLLYEPVQLLERGMPFVKVELLRDNPRGASLRAVRREMQKRGYDESLIEFDR